MKQQNMLVKSNSGVDVQMIFHGNNAFMDATNPKHALCLGKNSKTKLTADRPAIRTFLAGRCRAGVYVLRF